VVETLVLSPSLGSTRAIWDRQVPAFEPRFRLVRHEHRGRDSVEALAKDVLDLLDSEGVERASFCGVSLGGVVGMWLAASAPERIDRLVLAATSAHFGPPEPWRERAALVRAEGTGPIVDATMDRWFTPAFQEREPFRRMLLESPREDYAACCEAIANWDFRDELRKISAPTVVITGADDPTAGPPHAQLLAEEIPDAVLVVFPDTAHMIVVERADAFNAAALDHLTQ